MRATLCARAADLRETSTWRVAVACETSVVRTVGSAREMGETGSFGDHGNLLGSAKTAGVVSVMATADFESCVALV